MTPKGYTHFLLAKNGGPEDLVQLGEPHFLRYPILFRAHKLSLLVSILVEISLFWLHGLHFFVDFFANACSTGADNWRVHA